jgi:small subunit ribosomal protein S11
MGKTKITTEINKEEAGKDKEVRQKDSAKDAAEEIKKASPKTPKKKVTSGVLHVEATFNNTKVLFADKMGNTLFWSSAGSLGFRGAKKGTPFAASKVGDMIGGRAAVLGVKDSDVVVLGVGSGREPAIRAFMAHGIEVTSILDATPVPHNGPKAKKPRRV